jgi:hypothetical protein
MPGAASGGPAALFLLVFLVFVQDAVACRVGTLCLRFEILIQLGELLLLLRRQPVRLRTEQLALEFGDLGFGLGELLVVFLRQCLGLLQQLTQVRTPVLLGRVCLEKCRHPRFQPLVRRPELVVVHDDSSRRKSCRSG